MAIPNGRVYGKTTATVRRKVCGHPERGGCYGTFWGKTSGNCDQLGGRSANTWCALKRTREKKTHRPGGRRDYEKGVFQKCCEACIGRK